MISAHSAKHLRRTEITNLEADGWKIEGDGKGRAETSSTSSPKADSNAWAERAAGIAAGKKDEAERWSNVMLSKSVQGKEFQAAARLVASPNMSATDILATLKKCQSDAELSRASAAKKQNEISAVWDRAIARNGA